MSKPSAGAHHMIGVALLSITKALEAVVRATMTRTRPAIRGGKKAYP
ncbi:MAG: hypothetical protein ABI083_15685 [Lapillicoccus sp.]